MPWNFPLWQVFRFLAPALMAGNIGLLKHASNVPQCALAIEALVRRAGFPRGAFQTLLIEARQVEHLLTDPRVAAVTVTGSEAAGRAIAAQAGWLIKKSVLELGGSDPFIVLPSADLDAAIDNAIQARCINNGQSCIAAKRFIVHDSIYAEFEKRFVAGMAALRIGDPMLETTDIGPLATPQVLEDLLEQVTRARESGGRVLTGGPAPSSKTATSATTSSPPSSPASCATPPSPRKRSSAPSLCSSASRSLDEAIAARQRHALRPGRQRLDHRRRRAAAPRRRAPMRRRLLQHPRRQRPAPTLRRHQALRLRPRALRRRHARVPQRQDRRRRRTRRRNPPHAPCKLASQTQSRAKRRTPLRQAQRVPPHRRAATRI